MTLVRPTRVGRNLAEAEVKARRDEAPRSPANTPFELANELSFHLRAIFKDLPLISQNFRDIFFLIVRNFLKFAGLTFRGAKY